jgi:hypothetical protein
MSGVHFAEGKITSMRKILDRLGQMRQSNAVKYGKAGDLTVITISRH